MKDVPVVVDVQADPGADVPALLDVEDDEDGVGARCTEEDNEPCTITNEHGSCVGEIVCLGERGLAPCNAKTPAAEVCNALDDNCDGETDEGLPLCDCGDGTCAKEGGETVEICPCDCRECGDGICSPCGESPVACKEDCCRTPEGPSVCGDGYCLGYGCGENPKDCPEDCGKDCGNGECERGENPFGCPEDCKRGECGNDLCEPTDGGPFACPSDCAPTCGDCACQGGESWAKCPIDCGFCGDGVCSTCPNFDESAETCPLDCCVPTADTDQTCDGVDDDCDGAVDDESCGTQAETLFVEEREMTAALHGDRLVVGLVVHKVWPGSVEGRLDIVVESLDGSFSEKKGQDFHIGEPVQTLSAELPAFAGAAEPDRQIVHVVRFELTAGATKISGVRSLFVTLPKSQVVLLGPRRFHAGVPTRIKLYARDPISGDALANQPLVVGTRDGDESDEQEVETDDEGAASVVVSFLSTGAGSIGVSLRGEEETATTHTVTVVRTSRVLVTTDKPLYQPGQTMHFRVLALEQPGLEPMAATACLLEVHDGKGNKVFKRRVSTSELGVASGSFRLASEVNPGTYRVRATVGDTATEKAVTVERYALPRFDLEIEVDKAFYLVGDTLRGTVRASHFFGKRVAGGAARVRLQTFDVEPSDLATVNGITDDEGMFAFEFELPDHLVGQDLEQGKAIVRLVAEVTDLAGQSVAEARGVHVAGDRLRVVVIPESGTLQPGMENIFYVFAEDPAGAPVAPAISFLAGEDAYSLQTDQDGFATAAHVPAGERVEVSWSAEDGRGPPVEGSAVFEVGRSRESVLVRTDRAIYLVGDTMEVRIFAPDARDRVYLDVLRRGQIVREEALDLTAGTVSAQVDLDSEMTGDLALSAYYLGDGGDIVRDEKLVWVDSSDSLHVSLTLDKEVYLPGEAARLRVDVSDASGMPVVAAIGVQVVDEAVFALSGNRPGVLRSYFELDDSIREPHYQIEGTGFDIAAIVTQVPGDDAGEVVRERRAEAAFAALGDTGARLFSSSWEGSLQRALERLEPHYEADKRSIFERTGEMAEAGELDGSGLLAWLGAQGDLLDLFGNPYRFAPAGVERIEMRSDGPDEQADTLDDWRTTFAFWEALRQGGPGWHQDAGAGTDAGMAYDAGGGCCDAGTSGNEGEDGPRVRKDFPETLYVHPDLITGPDGQAELEIYLADSITEWRVSSMANTAGGLLGSNATGLTVFMDFFVDIDLPRTLTRGDEVHFPVAVFNYLDEPQTVSLTVEVGEWAELLSSATTPVSLGPGEVRGVEVGLRALAVGWHGVTVFATGSGGANDAIMRSVEVVPDGVEVRNSTSGKVSDSASIMFPYPSDAIESTVKAIVKIHPGPVAQVVEGLDSLLRMPSGCFEQTTATLWPNALVLDYLTTSMRSVPEIEIKAREYIGLGYQRLLTFECEGGGFTWFGDPAPPNAILSAMGVMELSDIAKVQETDETLIPRTMDFLAATQAADGSWHEDRGSEFANVRYTDLMTTCFVTWALAQAGGGQAADAGFEYASTRVDANTPTYALALCANAFSTLRPESAETSSAVVELVSRARQDGEEKVFWEPGAGEEGNYPGASAGSTVEATALAVLALLDASTAPDLSARGLAYLVENKDSFGSWGTTHATILSLKAFLKSLQSNTGQAVGDCTILLNDEVVGMFSVSEDNSDILRQFEIGSLLARQGSNRVNLAFSGEGSLMYQLVRSHFVPGSGASGAEGPIGIEVSYDKTKLSTEDTVSASATITNRAERMLPMVLLDLGVPPGFAVLTTDLETAAREQRIQRYELSGRQILVYLESIAGGETVELSYGLQAKYPLKVKAPDSSVVLYYDESTRASSPGADFEVNAVP